MNLGMMAAGALLVLPALATEREHLVPGYVFEDSRGRVVIHSIGQLQDLTARAAELDEAQKALENLLEEARHASIPPGWLR